MMKGVEAHNHHLNTYRDRQLWKAEEEQFKRNTAFSTVGEMPEPDHTSQIAIRKNILSKGKYFCAAKVYETPICGMEPPKSAAERCKENSAKSKDKEGEQNANQSNSRSDAVVNNSDDIVTDSSPRHNRTNDTDMQRPATICPGTLRSRTMANFNSNNIDRSWFPPPFELDCEQSWNSRKKTDAFKRAEIMGTVGKQEPWAAQTVDPDIQELLASEGYNLDDHTKRELSHRYIWNTTMHRGNNEVDFAALYPNGRTCGNRLIPSDFPADPVRATKKPTPSLGRSAPSSAKNADMGQSKSKGICVGSRTAAEPRDAWMSGGGKARAKYGPNPHQFISKSSKNDIIPGYSGHIGSRRVVELDRAPDGSNPDELDNPYEPAEVLRLPLTKQPKPSTMRYLDHIPGYTGWFIPKIGNTVNLRATANNSNAARDSRPTTAGHALADQGQPEEQRELTRAVTTIGSSRMGGSNNHHHEGPLSRMTTTVQPNNPHQ